MTGTRSWNGELYDRVASPQLRWGTEVLERLAASVAERPQSRVLDAGCGSGLVTEVLLARYPAITVTAGDKSASMRDAAQRRLASQRDRVEVVELDLDRDPVFGDGEDRRFDAILSTGTFHWVIDHAAMYGRLARLLGPGGVLVAQAGGAGSIADVRAALDDLGIDWRSLNRYADRAETEAWLQGAGFTASWVWLSTELVEFERHSELVRYLLGGALSPYLAHLTPDQRQETAEAVADRLGAPRLVFTRVNVLARL